MAADVAADPRLRVLVVSLGRRGGVTEYGWLMTRALARQAEVAVIASELADNRGKWATLESPQLHVRTFSSILELVMSFLALPRFARIWRFARRFRPDVVFYPGGHAWKPLLDMLLPRSATTVLTVHDPLRHAGDGSLGLRLMDLANRRRAAGYVLLNEAQRARFVAANGLDPCQVTVIPHGVFDDYAAGSGRLPDVAALTGLAPSDIGRYVLFVGRIRQYKGLETLLAAYGMLEPEEAGPLVIAGSGELSEVAQERLHALEGRPVHLRNDWLSDAELAALVASARFVVLPYHEATQSGVIPLASAFGVPAIASATDGLVEQVIDGTTGMLTPPRDASALGSCLVRAWTMDDAEYGRMSRACRAHAEATWGWDRLASDLVRFCESLRR